ncbi:MAG: CTP synthase [Nitrososphaerota archaeon]|nr:CTP synthase [Nitrososphaerota archaeon]MDG6959711.1 CTP synthase [Nitrososphaerota archaeon]MDG6965041.1 CTP synthase [Nitrososphaerota archaeon]MDG6968089.1 CTP synthase [Nitrososphaerota archaeon]MDG6968985.1 CTP synthase [Nitrososphaerota archaeon]
MPKYLFVTGGVMSGLGKGIITSSVAKLLQLSGARVTCLKIDPYLNFDAGTMNPYTHGEVFVTDDGGETDMDIGNYERFLNMDMSKSNNITTGQIYKKVIDDERKGLFLGKSVQIIPHVTDEIKRRIRDLAEREKVDVLVVECGGTVGDIESLPFLEAFRQMRMEDGPSKTLFLHVSLAPELSVVGEMKTKPTQHSVQEMRRIGIQPDVMVIRGSRPLPADAKEKIALFTSVPTESVVSDPDVESIYLVPRLLEKEGALPPVRRQLGLKAKGSMRAWNDVADRFVGHESAVRIAMVGKYANLADSYVSVNQALAHAGAVNGAEVRISWIESEEIEKDESKLRQIDAYDGVVLPQGFGGRGVEGKIAAANRARVAKVPFLGLCYGFQLASVSFARHVLGLKGANSTEVDPKTPHPVIDLLPEQRGVSDLGGTMRLGGHDVFIERPSRAFDIYKAEKVRERHRHRYELNQTYLKRFEEKGMRFTAFSDSRRRAEIMELEGHPFYMGTQYHPEYVSRPERPEPVYVAFVEACAKRARESKAPERRRRLAR